MENLRKELEEIRREYRQLITYLRLVNKMRERVTTALELQEVLDEICQSLVDYFGAAFARIWLYNRESNELRLVSSRGIYTRTDGSRSVIKLGTFKKGKLQRIALEKVPHYSNSIQDDRDSPIRDPEWARRNGLVSFAGYPLVLRDELVGVMVFFSRNRLSETILEVMSLYASLATLAIRDAQLITEQKELALTDPLTKLKNRRYLGMYLEETLKVSRRYGDSLTVAMVDIDHFKKINDTYGHPVGDEVLASLAEILRSSVRESDLVVRYGGEEFTLVLQRTNRERAKNVLERIREDIAGRVFDTQAGKLSLTVSIGYTTCDCNGEKVRMTRFLRVADAALYRAKEGGRNRVEFLPLETDIDGEIHRSEEETPHLRP
ncbi:MAG: GGDEF domain-containing protein [Deltaproteobacteria bacterium]|nr:MAG: GGDEF domain-containing protein [Deltaproteobacteria bacterium]